MRFLPFIYLPLRGLLLSICLNRRALIIGFLLSLALAPSAFAQKAVHDLDALRAKDLSLRLLRDNYDAWSEILMKKLLVDTDQKIAPIQENISDLERAESKIAAEIKDQLIKIYRDQTVDQSSVHAALMLSRMSSSDERLEYLKNAVRMAQTISPGTLATFRVSVAYLSELLSRRAFSEATRFGERLQAFVDSKANDSFNKNPEVCLASILLGDAEFERSNFARAEANYSRGLECLRRETERLFPGIEPGVRVRLAWSAFRLMKYADVLVHLEQYIAISNDQQRPLPTSVSNDLAVVLGVSLSELAPRFPSSAFTKAIAAHGWVAEGLARAIRYLTQREQVQLAVRWTIGLEAEFERTSVALDFFINGLEAMERDGNLDSAIDFKTRATFALSQRGGFSQFSRSNNAQEERRRTLVVAWVKDIVAFRKQQDVSVLSAASVKSLYRVAETLSEERVDVCSDVDTYLDSYQMLSAARQSRLAERVLSWFSNCKNWSQRRSEVFVSKIELMRADARESVRSDEAWTRYINASADAINEFPRNQDVRRLTVESMNESIEVRRNADAERLFVMILLTHEEGQENTQLERQALISASARLLVLPDVSPEMAAAGASLLRRLSSVASADDQGRKVLSASFSFYAQRQSLVAINRGQFSKASKILLESAKQYGDGADYALDLRLRAAEISCLSALDPECLMLTDFGTEPNARAQGLSFSSHDLYFLARWRADALMRSGRFLSAAQMLFLSAQYARDSGRGELIQRSEADVIQAGDLFVDFKMWSEAQKAKDFLNGMSSRKAVSLNQTDAFLRWSLEAIRVQLFDVAAALSADLIPLSASNVSASKSRGKRLESLMSFAVLVQSATRAMASGTSLVRTEEPLLKTLAALRNENIGIFVSDKKYDGYARSFVSLVYQQWQHSLILEAEAASRGVDLISYQKTLSELDKNFDRLMRVCLASRDFRISAALPLSNCSAEIGNKYLTFIERLKLSSGRLSAADTTLSRKIDGQLYALGLKVAMAKSQRRSAEKRSLDVSSRMAERQLELFSLLSRQPSSGGNGGVQ